MADERVHNLTAPFLKGGTSGQKEREFELVAYTGAQLKGFWGDFIIDLAGIETKSQVPILREHQRDRIVGWSSQTYKDSRGLVLKGTVTEKTKDGQEVLALAETGFPWQASMGVIPKETRKLSKGEVASVNGIAVPGPLEIWSKSLCREVSLVSWGADNQTSMQLLTGGKPGSQREPSTFDEAVNLLLEQGHPAGHSLIELASKRWPGLFEAYCRTITDPAEPL